MSELLNEILVRSVQQDVLEAFDTLDAAASALAKADVDQDVYAPVAAARDATFLARTTLDERFGRVG